MKKVAMRRCNVLVLLLVSCMVQRLNAQTVSDVNVDSKSSTNSSSAGATDLAADDYSPDWLFPINKLDRSLPSWFHIGGEFRGRLEAQKGIGFTARNDFYYL